MQYATVLDGQFFLANNPRMNSAAFATRLEELLLADPRIKKWDDGRVNVTQAAKVLKMNQSTLQRMLKGGSRQPRPENAEAILKFFGITYDQLIGVAPFSSDDQESLLLARQIRDSASSLEIAELVEGLPVEAVLDALRPALESMPLADRVKVARLALDEQPEDGQ